MADENRIATFEWLNQNLSNFKKVTSPPTTKKGVRKDELITNYNVNESLLGGHSNNRLVRRELCVGLISKYMVDGYDVNDMIYQSDDKLIIVGKFDIVNGLSCSNIVRLNVDGSLDTTFNCTTNDIINCVQLQPDGKILIGGWFSTVNGIIQNKIARINIDGTLDTTFTSYAETQNSSVYAIGVDSNSKIIMAGFFKSYQGYNVEISVRLNINGTIDTSWQRASTNNLYDYHTDINATIGHSIVVLPDNSVFIGGKNLNIVNGNTTYLNRSLIFYKSNGQVDFNFTSNVSTSTKECYLGLSYNNTTSVKNLVCSGYRHTTNTSDIINASLTTISFTMTNNLVNTTSVVRNSMVVSTDGSKFNKIKHTNDTQYFLGGVFYVGSSNLYGTSTYGLNFNSTTNSWNLVHPAQHGMGEPNINSFVVVNKNNKTISGLGYKYNNNLLFLDPVFN